MTGMAVYLGLLVLCAFCTRKPKAKKKKTEPTKGSYIVVAKFTDE